MLARRFQNYYDKPATELDLADVQGFLHYLLTKQKLIKETVNTYNTGLRFLYSFVLDRPLDMRMIPRAP